MTADPEPVSRRASVGSGPTDEVVSIATMHGKERQFGPPLWGQLRWGLVVAGVDTDQLGTFAGDVRRVAGPLETARRKARWGMEATGHDRGLASEGSFGPHPTVPFITVAEELVVLLDDREGLEVVERVATTDTNARSIEVADTQVPERFLESVGFPEHALIVTGPGATAPHRKGLQDSGTLRDAIEQCLRAHPRAVVATDLRAHMNPTRQGVLRTLADHLAARLRSRCPRCEARGWGISGTDTGLPCAWCGTPTMEVAASLATCSRNECGFTATYPVDGRGDPGRCPRCNP